MLGALAAGNPAVQQQVVQAGAVAPLLANLYARRRHPRVVREVVDALGALGGPPPLAKLLANPSPVVVQRVAANLQELLEGDVQGQMKVQLGECSALPSLTDLLVRYGVMYAAGAQDDKTTSSAAFVLATLEPVLYIVGALCTHERAATVLRAHPRVADTLSALAMSPNMAVAFLAKEIARSI